LVTRSPADWIPYCGAAPAPAELIGRWNFDPPLLLLASLVLVAAWQRPQWRTPANFAALAIFLLLFVSPFCALGSALFTARVVHHLVLALVLGPLLALSLGRAAWLESWSLPLLTAVQAAVFWAWHAPALYALALSNDAAFWLMQVSITASATLWWARLRRSPAAAAVGALLATMVQMGLLGALITFAGSALYAPHRLTTQAWGFSPLEDQQIAGLVMWAPAAAAYLLVAVTILYRSMTRTGARAVRV
jgi:putative membrane protein